MKLRVDQQVLIMVTGTAADGTPCDAGPSESHSFSPEAIGILQAATTDNINFTISNPLNKPVNCEFFVSMRKRDGTVSVASMRLEFVHEPVAFELRAFTPTPL